MKWLGVVPLVLFTACFDPTNAPSCTISCSQDSQCPDGQTCNTQSGTCTAGEDCTTPATCTPGDFVACVNGAARTCNAAGDGTEDAPCGTPGCNVDAKRCNTCVPDEVSCSTDNTQVLTCASDGSGTSVTDTCIAQCAAGTMAVAAHCKYLEPKWLPDICDMPATVDTFNPNASAQYSSDLDTNCTGGVITQTGGRSICVVRAKAITIASIITLTVTGSRPIAFVADTSLTLDGTIDAGATGTTSGPGGGATTSGGAASSTVGGGGAAFAQVGGAGGDTTSGNGAAGGNPAVDPLTLANFAGGPRGGSPGGIMPPLTASFGGGGGGGVLLVACRGSATLNTGSTIDVRGGGGAAQRDTIFGAQIAQSDCGAGGGAGGYVVVEGLTGVTMSGGIYGNGGGGGGGNTANDTSGGAGGDGPRSVGAGGAGSAGNGGGTGGNGGYRSGAPGLGGGTTSGTNGGGGGGSMGVTHVFVPTGITPSVTTTNMSPLPTTHAALTR
jgi:hypothetical protein